MIFLELFFTFFKIGLFTFGGGYAMIPLVSEVALSFGMTSEQIINFIAVAESTPGPIAINMATFIGSAQGGLLGSVVATLGVVLPSFIIILLIASLLKNVLKTKPVQGVLAGVRPVIVALILSTALTMGLSVILNVQTFNSTISLDYKTIIIFAIIAIIALTYKKFRKKALSPILLILISGIMGVFLF